VELLVVYPTYAPAATADSLTVDTAILEIFPKLTDVKRPPPTTPPTKPPPQMGKRFHPSREPFFRLRRLVGVLGGSLIAIGDPGVSPLFTIVGLLAPLLLLAISKEVPRVMEDKDVGGAKMDSEGALLRGDDTNVLLLLLLARGDLNAVSRSGDNTCRTCPSNDDCRDKTKNICIRVIP